MMAELLSELLLGAGHEVRHVIDGLYGLEALGLEKSSEPPFKADAIVSDCMMPRMDGLSFVTRLASEDETRDLPVIVLTTKHGMEEPFKALSNVKLFLVKPPDPLDFQAAVAKVFGAA